LARLALADARGEPENIAFAKGALASALSDNGQSEEALREAQEAWELARVCRIPAESAIRFLSQISNYGSQLGADAVVATALAALNALPVASDDDRVAKQRCVARAAANHELRTRLASVLNETAPATAAATTKCMSLAEANARVARPLIQLWKEIPQCAAEFYDFWGRGNFVRFLLNARCFPNTFNITVEVRSLDDVKRAAAAVGIVRRRSDSSVEGRDR
jgi:hypothetical protein